MLPGNADEADIAARCVAYSDYGLHCLREARGRLGDIACFLKCTAQAASMERQARGARSLLLPQLAQLAQLAQLGGGFANFAGNAPSQLNGLAAISGRFARVVATKAIPFCSWI
jgi:hypothetical protein